MSYLNDAVKEMGKQSVKPKIADSPAIPSVDRRELSLPSVKSSH